LIDFIEIAGVDGELNEVPENKLGPEVALTQARRDVLGIHAA
jgi:hypothetical protein